jgi:hypothetical protein
VTELISFAGSPLNGARVHVECTADPGVGRVHVSHLVKRTGGVVRMSSESLEVRYPIPDVALIQQVRQLAEGLMLHEVRESMRYQGVQIASTDTVTVKE